MKQKKLRRVLLITALILAVQMFFPSFLMLPLYYQRALPYGSIQNSACQKDIDTMRANAFSIFLWLQPKISIRKPTKRSVPCHQLTPSHWSLNPFLEDMWILWM